MTFQEHCRALGLDLLAEDIKFIKSRLGKVRLYERKAILNRYAGLWLSMLGECEDPIKAQNWGRRAANNYLLEI